MSVSSRQALACRRHALLFRLHSVFRLHSPVVPWPALLAARQQKYPSSGSTMSTYAGGFLRGSRGRTRGGAGGARRAMD